MLNRFEDAEGSAWAQVKILGRGAFGEVWMALKYDLTLIAVKVMQLGKGKFAEKRKLSFETERTVRREQRGTKGGP